MGNYVEGCGNPLSVRTTEKFENLKRLRVCQIAPEFVSQSPDGKTIALSLICKKVLMVYFRASWCEGCEAENPNIMRLYNAFHDKGFDIYAVALDSDKTE